jgi:uncharacterized protein (TIGR03435 family)
MARLLVLVSLVGVGLVGVPTIRAQAAQADAEPAFEVATIKPGSPDARGFGMRISGRRFSTIHASLSDLVAFAYGLHPRQITGGPAWLETEKYDLLAEASAESKPNSLAMRAMVQKLIVDRFGLTFHRDRKTLSVYAIVIGKGGPKFLNSPGEANGNPGYGFQGLGKMTVSNARIVDFAGWMQRYVVDRPVVDRTEISGRFNFTLNWTPDESQFIGLAGQLGVLKGDVEQPDLYTAIQQQLGLKLESTKLSVEVLVIDHVEKPSEN